MNDKNLGSSFDSWHRDEGIYEDMSAKAIERERARQNAAAIRYFGDEAVRRRLGPTALTVFRRIMEIWQAPGKEARQLLGLAPETDLDSVDSERLGEEQLLRISYLLGIYKALQIYWGEGLADQWVRLANMDAMFGGRSPLAYMAGGGLDALRNVRDLLKAWCVGN